MYKSNKHIHIINHHLSESSAFCDRATTTIILVAGNTVAGAENKAKSECLTIRMVMECEDKVMKNS